MLDLASNLANYCASCILSKGDGGALLPCMAGSQLFSRSKRATRARRKSLGTSSAPLSSQFLVFLCLI